MNNVTLFDRRGRVLWSSWYLPQIGEASVGIKAWDFVASEGDGADAVKRAFAVAAICGEPQQTRAQIVWEGKPGEFIETTWMQAPRKKVAVVAVARVLDIRTALLTPRERQVASYMALGQASQEIGESLGISASTVDTHRGRIREKIGIEDAMNLRIWCYENFASRV